MKRRDANGIRGRRASVEGPGRVRRRVKTATWSFRAAERAGSEVAPVLAPSFFGRALASVLEPKVNALSLTAACMDFDLNTSEAPLVSHLKPWRCSAPQILSGFPHCGLRSARYSHPSANVHRGMSKIRLK